MAWGFYGLYAVPVMCPSNGCSADALRAIYYPYVMAFSVGGALVISGAVTIGMSYLVPKPEVSVKTPTIVA